MKAAFGRARSPSTFVGVVGATLVPAFGLVALGNASRRPPAGTLDGVVQWGGDSIPGPTVIANTTDPGVCGERQSLEDLLIDEVSRGIANVIVALVDAAGGEPAKRSEVRQAEPFVLDNVDCRFEPHASVLATGEAIVARNSDDLLHTVHYYGALERNLSLPRRGVVRTLVVDRPGMIVVKCDVHGWMQAFIRVDPHPYHAVTDSEGRFRITGIPPGDYTVELWHETLGTRTRTIGIEDGSTTVLDVEYLPESDP